MSTKDATRFALVADIHSNRQALDRALAYVADADVEAVYCLGDIVGYGGDPAYCVERVRDQCDVVIAGNHDLAVAREELRDRFNPDARRAIEQQVELLDPEDIGYLAGLPPTAEFHSLTIGHSGFRDPEAFTYVHSRREARHEFDAFSTRFAAIGHTHVPAVFRLGQDGEVVRLLGREAPGGVVPDGSAIDERDVPTGRTGRLLMNPGAVGQPRDRDRRAALAIVDTAVGTFRLVRLAYDISGAQDAIRRNGMPLVQAGRLGLGM